MPRISLWRTNKSSDYKFLDNTIREMYTVGGIDLYIHKYMGPAVPAGEEVPEDNILRIEDLLFLENRNREYDNDVKIMRGVYNVRDLDFDLSQFGFFIAGDTLYINFHYNDMIDILGRKLINGDVIEVPNLKDYNPLNTMIPQALPKFYVVQEGNFASEGFSQTWQPHLWRVKTVPLKGGQEYKEILEQCIGDTNPGIDGSPEETDECCTLGDLICQYNKNIAINDGVVMEAEEEVPLSGYDTAKFFILGAGEDFGTNIITSDNIAITSDNDLITADNGSAEEVGNGKMYGYLTGDGMPPNGKPVTKEISFPPEPAEGQYVLRVDYMPSRLFQYDGTMWAMIEDNVRTEMYLGHPAKTQRNSFVNNDEMIQTTDRGLIPSRQSLSKILEPKEDN